MNCPDALTGASMQPVNLTVRRDVNASATKAPTLVSENGSCSRSQGSWRVWIGPTTDYIFFVVIGVGVIAVVLFRVSRGD